MSGKVLLTDDAAYKALAEHYASTGSSLNMKNLFANDSDRFDKFRWDLIVSTTFNIFVLRFWSNTI